MKFKVGDKVRVKPDCKSFGSAYIGREGIIKHETPEKEELYWIDFGDKSKDHGISISGVSSIKITGCYADGSTPFEANALEKVEEKQ